MKTKIFSTIIIIFIISSIFILIDVQPVKGTNWLSGWQYRKSHVVNNATNSGTNYQIQIIVINGSSADSGNTVYINNKANSTFDDIRFTSNDGTTLLKYWMESLNSAINATFWVKITSDLSSSNQTIYIYYGNSGVSTTSDGQTTFIFFDNFDDASINSSLWTKYGSPTESGGLLSWNSQSYGIYSTSSFINDRIKWRGNHAVAQYVYWGCSAAADINGALTSTESYFEYSDHISAISNNVTNYNIVNLGNLGATYSLWEMLWVNASRAEFIVNGTSKSTHTTYVSYTAQPIKFYDYIAAISCNIDWIFVGKYVYPEPVHSTWGNEETYTPTSYTFNGTITETFAISSIKTAIFTRYGTEITNFQVLSTRSFAEYLYSLILINFNVTSSKSILFQPSGLVLETFTTEGQAFKTFTLYGSIIISFALTLETGFWALVTFSFDYSMLIVILFMLASNIVLCIKRVPIISFVIGAFSFAIGAYEVNNITIPANPLFSVMLCLVGIVSIIINTLDMRK